MIAFLGMYDMPGTAAANDAFWQAIRAELGEGPDALTRTGDPWPVWTDPDLLLAQTCGYPYRASLHGQVALVGTPDYGLPGCPPGYYNSVLIARVDDPRATLAAFDGARLAYNESLSQSGWAAPVHAMIREGVAPGALVQTGAHSRSAQTVAEGAADLAGIDALTWELLTTHRPELTGGLREISRTTPTPTLPYITAGARDPAPIRAAISRAIDALPDTTRATLHLRGLVAIPAEAYRAVPTPPGPQTLALRVPAASQTR